MTRWIMSIVPPVVPHPRVRRLRVPVFAAGVPRDRTRRAVGGGIRFAFRHFPLTEIHPHALAAAAAAEAAALPEPVLGHARAALPSPEGARGGRSAALRRGARARPRTVRERPDRRRRRSRESVETSRAARRRVRCSERRPCSSTVSCTAVATTLLPSTRHWPAELPPPRQLQ